jgi:pyruvate,water dikinase
MVATAAEDNETWEAPGPGLWERDAAHQERPFSGLLLEQLIGPMTAGTGRAFERFGLPIAMEPAVVRGWLYASVVPIGEDDFAARMEAAVRAVAERPWRLIADEWHASVRAPMAARNKDLQRVDVTALDDAGLAAHLEAALATLAAGAERHFLNAVAHWIGVGLLLNEAGRVAGWTPAQTLAALAGASPASTAPVAALARVAAASRAVGAAWGLLDRAGAAAAVVEALRASTKAGEALNTYLDEYGWQVFTGFDFTHQAMAELPELLLATIRRAAPRVPADGNQFAALLGAADPSARETLAQVIDDAVRAYGIRDDDSPVTIHHPIGLVRRALIEAGARLAGRGVLQDADDIFEATAAELQALLRGTADGRLATDLAERGARRRAPFTVPPRRLGAEEDAPDGELPAEMGAILGALLAAMALEDITDDEAAVSESVSGTGASAGVFEGRARVVSGTGDFDRLEAGDVLVTSITTPAYNVVLPLLGAVVTDRGGILSHPAIVAREFGIPAVVGTGDATTRIPDGARVRVDGIAGTVTLLG